MANRLPFLFRRISLLTRVSLLPPPPAIAPRSQRSLLPTAISRNAHSIPKPRPTSTSPPTTKATAEQQEATPAAESTIAKKIPKPKHPSYNLTFTCKPCGHRSAHNVSKQAYHHGSTLIACPKCQSRHVISDHLGIFGDRKMTVEEILRERGELIRKGTLGPDGDIEFWADEQGKDTGAEHGDGVAEGKSGGA